MAGPSTMDKSMCGSKTTDQVCRIPPICLSLSLPPRPADPVSVWSSADKSPRPTAVLLLSRIEKPAKAARPDCGFRWERHQSWFGNSQLARIDRAFCRSLNDGWGASEKISSFRPADYVSGLLRQPFTFYMSVLRSRESTKARGQDCKRIFGLFGWSVQAPGHDGNCAWGAKRICGPEGHRNHRLFPTSVRPFCHQVVSAAVLRM